MTLFRRLAPDITLVNGDLYQENENLKARVDELERLLNEEILKSYRAYTWPGLKDLGYYNSRCVAPAVFQRWTKTAAAEERPVSREDFTNPCGEHRDDWGNEGRDDV